jgi:signal transduction histidine kinase
MEKQKIEVLLIEDNLAEADLIKEMLAKAPRDEYSVHHAAYLGEAIGWLQGHQFDVALVDLGLPDSQGLDTALSVRNQSSRMPIVVLTCLDDEDAALKSLEMGIQDYLVKSEINGKLLIRAIRYAIQRKRAEAEIKSLNASLAARASELEDANQELEAFNYTAAHDLRQPVNTIGSYCQLIKKLCGVGLDEKCKGYLQEAYDSSLRMSRLIGVLLNFSRLTHVELRRVDVDLSAMAHEVAGGLKLTGPERQVDFRIADRIVAHADPSLLRMVLDNLLGNAWKYTGKREEVVIEFGAQEIDGVTTYFVRDNGPGFDKACSDKLFIPFQRLPDAEECRGFGVGLATVERIIGRHGGRIWAEGEPEKGATFYFTLAVESS